MCVPRREVLQKIGQTCGGTAKIRYWVPKNRSDYKLCKLQMPRSLRSDRVVRPDFGGEWLGDQSFGFWYLLYAIVRQFWSKNFDWGSHETVVCWETTAFNDGFAARSALGARF